MTHLFRILTGLAAVAGLAVVAGEAAAQYYPPGRYYPPDPYYARGPYRGPPPVVDEDGYVPEAPPPGAGPYRNRAPQGGPYRPEPPVARYPLETPPTDRPVYEPQQPAPYGARPTYSDRPYNDRPYNDRPIYNEPYDRAPTGALPNARQDDGLPRPPADITGSVPASPNYATPNSAPPSAGGQTYASLPPDYQPEEGSPQQLPENLRRQIVDFPSHEPAGTLVVDTPNTYLYYVLGNGKAIRYGVGVGRDGFTWSGAERVSRMTEWPDWYPPKEMIERQPYLPRMMAGGATNPLGARALYLGKTLYRIHGTNQPSTIGKFVSSGCVRLLNEDIEDLFRRVQVGTRVVVLGGGNAQAAVTPAPYAGAGALAPRAPAAKPVTRSKVSTKLPKPVLQQPATAKPAEPKPPEPVQAQTLPPASVPNGSAAPQVQQ